MPYAGLLVGKRAGPKSAFIFRSMRGGIRLQAGKTPPLHGKRRTF